MQTVPTLLLLVVGVLLIAGLLLMAGALAPRPGGAAGASQATATCPRCGHPHEQRARFCARCGVRLRGAAV